MYLRITKLIDDNNSNIILLLYYRNDSFWIGFGIFYYLLIFCLFMLRYRTVWYCRGLKVSLVSLGTEFVFISFFNARNFFNKLFKEEANVLLKKSPICTTQVSFIFYGIFSIV